MLWGALMVVVRLQGPWVFLSPDMTLYHVDNEDALHAMCAEKQITHRNLRKMLAPGGEDMKHVQNWVLVERLLWVKRLDKPDFLHAIVGAKASFFVANYSQDIAGMEKFDSARLQTILNSCDGLLTSHAERRPYCPAFGISWVRELSPPALAQVLALRVFPYVSAPSPWAEPVRITLHCKYVYPVLLSVCIA